MSIFSGMILMPEDSVHTRKVLKSKKILPECLISDILILKNYFKN